MNEEPVNPKPEQPELEPQPGTSVATKADTAQDEPNAPKLEASMLAMARTPQEKFTAYQLSTHVRQQQMVAAASKELAQSSWGKEISANARAAVVRYCLEIGADPLRHVFVLGGNIYLNAQFYMELVAANPKFMRDEVDFIHDDTRASKEERDRRAKLRVEYAVPENAPGAAIVTLFYQDGRGPFIGVNWAGVKDKDPVGKQDPTKSAQTRAYRKAAIKAEPAWFKQSPRLRHAEEVLAQGREIPNENVVALPPGQPTEQQVAERARTDREPTA
jgi:hypothetical protein